jgi:aspartate aminotransferase-like enzyme
MGLELFPEESVASDTVTAVKVPDGVSCAGLLAALREEHDIVLGGGQGPVEGKILRIGHMGRVEPSEIQDVIDALGAVLPTLTAGG